MAKRDEFVPEDLVHHLCATIPNFSTQTLPHQCELARMVWHGSSKTRIHHHFENAMTYHFKELELAFGRNYGQTGFDAINGRVDLFEVTLQWSVKSAWTKGYQFSKKAIASRDAYLDEYWKKVTRLLMMSGKALKKIPAAVPSRDMNGNTTRQKVFKLPSRTPVNQALLEGLRTWLNEMRQEWRDGRAPQRSLFTEYGSLEFVDRLYDMTSKILRMSRTDVVGDGFIAQQYVRAKSGRLYARGISLQTAPSLIKEAALDGLLEYDFSNCHFDILRQMAAKHDYQCTAIADYLNNKVATRQAIADQAGISKDQAKICLLALMYGARASEWKENAIPEEIGVEAAKRLYKVPLFRAIHTDITSARAVILKNWKRTANGSLTNAFGKAISGGAKPVQKLAHLTQGVEAMALQSVLELYSSDIVLLQHDGFVSTQPLPCKAITEAVFDSTGYRLELEEKRIQPNPDAHFMRNRMQLEKK